MMNKKKSNPKAFLTTLLAVSFIGLMVQVSAQKEVSLSAAPAATPEQGKYLELKPDQLNLLGFECTPDGLFYKNLRFGRGGNGILCLYFTEDINNASIVLRQGEEITGSTTPEKILKNQQTTTYDFYPVVVAHKDGFRNLDMLAAEGKQDMKMLPVQVSMADLKLGSRADTLVFWFKPTEALRQVLAGIAKTEEYIQSVPPEPLQK